MSSNSLSNNVTANHNDHSSKDAPLGIDSTRFMASVNEVRQDLAQEVHKLSEQVDKVKHDVQETYKQSGHYLQEHVIKKPYGFGSVLLVFGVGLVLGKLIK